MDFKGIKAMKQYANIVKDYCNISVNYLDVQAHKPDWSIEQCQSFLDKTHKIIKGNMAETMWETISDLLTINDIN